MYGGKALRQLGPVVAQCRRPRRITQDLIIRFERHIGIDQRSASEATADEHADRIADSKIEQGIGVTDRHIAIWPQELDMSRQFSERLREIAWHIFVSALKYHYAAVLVRQPHSGDRAAISGTDNQHFTGFIERAAGLVMNQLFDRVGKQVTHRSSFFKT